MALAGTATAAYAASVAAHDLVDHELSAAAGGMARRASRSSIAVIADLHAGGPNVGRARIAQVVDGDQCAQAATWWCCWATSSRPIASSPRSCRTTSGPANSARLRAPLGVYAILGNHDWWHDVARRAPGADQRRHPGPGKRCRAARAMPAVALLAGRSGDQLAYRLGHGRFRGVDDLPGDARARRTRDDPVILLAHEPDIFTDRAGPRSAHALPAIPMAARSACRSCGRLRALGNTGRVSPMVTSSSRAAT